MPSSGALVQTGDIGNSRSETWVTHCVGLTPERSQPLCHGMCYQKSTHSGSHHPSKQAPQSRYRPSDRTYPEQLPTIEYNTGELVRKVQRDGRIYFKGHLAMIGQAFRGYPIWLQPSGTDGIFDAYFGSHWIRQFDLREAEKA
jgi:hypothetical protein